LYRPEASLGHWPRAHEPHTFPPPSVSSSVSNVNAPRTNALRIPLWLLLFLLQARGVSRPLAACARATHGVAAVTPPTVSSPVFNVNELRTLTYPPMSAPFSCIGPRRPSATGRVRTSRTRRRRCFSLQARRWAGRTASPAWWTTDHGLSPEGQTGDSPVSAIESVVRTRLVAATTDVTVVCDCVSNVCARVCVHGGQWVTACHRRGGRKTRLFLLLSQSCELVAATTEVHCV